MSKDLTTLRPLGKNHPLRTGGATISSISVGEIKRVREARKKQKASKDKSSSEKPKEN